MQNKLAGDGSADQNTALIALEQKLLHQIVIRLAISIRSNSSNGVFAIGLQ